MLQQNHRGYRDFLSCEILTDQDFSRHDQLWSTMSGIKVAEKLDEWSLICVGVV